MDREPLQKLLSYVSRQMTEAFIEGNKQETTPHGGKFHVGRYTAFLNVRDHLINMLEPEETE